MKWTSLIFLALGIAIGAIVGCQSYSFEPVTPLAVSQTSQSRTLTARLDKANAMLVVDRSGSLWLPIDSTLPACHPDGGSGTCGTIIDDCPPSCPTRDRVIKSSMQTFLTNYGTAARFGLIFFPIATDQCGAGTVRVPIPTASDDATLQANANNINSILQSSSISGGTPTSATLATLASNPQLQDPNLLNTYILITDGVPNCNPNNPHDACNPYNPPPGNGACGCTPDIGDCCPHPCSPNPPGTCPPGPTNPPNPYRQLGCLDADGTAATMASLKANSHISGFVLGVGDETLGNGVALNAMAEAGGFPRLCPNGTNAECGSNNPCITATHKCTREYYQAGSSQDLASALDAIRGQIQVGCSYILNDTPSDPQLVSVIVNGQPSLPGPDTWTYVPGPPPKIVFAPLGAICTQLQNSTPSNPVTLEFRILQAP